MNCFKIIFSILILLISACSRFKTEQEGADNSGIEVIDNTILKDLYERDLEIRGLDAKVDTIRLEDYDKVHREKVFELLSQGLVITSLDKFRASWILQHTNITTCEGELKSISSENYLLAYYLMTSAIKDTAKYHQKIPVKLAALNYDRYLLYTK